MLVNGGPAGDLDDDGDVDLADVAWFTSCLGGPEVALGQDCAVADFDADADVDLADYAQFQSFYQVGR